MSIQITTTELPVGYVDEEYRFTLTALTYPEDAPLTWKTDNDFPKELSINEVTGTISGLCQQGFWSSINFGVTNSVTGEKAQKVLTLYIASGNTLDIITDFLPAGIIGQPYQQTLIAAGGVEPYLWSATGLPEGLQLESNIISGKPTGAGTFTLNLNVSDSANPVNRKQKPLTLVVAAQPQTLVISTPALAAATVSEPYSQQLTAEGGIEPYQWSSDGLPIGLSISGNFLSGQVSVAGGSVPLTLSVTDSKQATASQFYLLDVNPQSSHTLKG